MTHESEFQKDTQSPSARYVESTREEILKFNVEAKKAARAGDQYTTEIYRRKGVSLDTIAYSIGLSGNKEYARFLLQQNPQSLNLATNLAMGFQSYGDSDFVRELVECWKADADMVRPSRSSCGPFHNRRLMIDSRRSFSASSRARSVSLVDEGTSVILRHRRSTSRLNTPLELTPQNVIIEKTVTFFTPHPPVSNHKKNKDASVAQHSCLKRNT